MTFITIVLITIIVILVLYILFFNNKYTTESIINLDESRKNMLKECCKDEECYSKPPFLQKYNKYVTIPPNSCYNNKKLVAESLDKMYNMMFTQDHYNKLLNDLNIRTDIDSSVMDRYEKEKELMKSKMIAIKQEMGTDAFDKMINDKYGITGGFDNFYTNFSPYEKTI